MHVRVATSNEGTLGQLSADPPRFWFSVVELYRLELITTPAGNGKATLDSTWMMISGEKQGRG